VDVAFSETVDHRFLKTAFVVEYVMRNANTLGDAARIIDVLTGAARALAVGCRAVVVELQRHADHIVTLGLEQRGRHRRVDTAGHGDDDTRIFRPAVKIETVRHGASYYR
jgi:hypothetical protein